MKNAILFSGFLFIASVATASAGVPVVFKTSNVPAAVQARLTTQIQQQFKNEDLRQIRVQTVQMKNGAPASMVLRLFSSQFHRFENVRVELGTRLQSMALIRDYHMPRVHSDSESVKCPDKSVQFISFAPNDDDFEQGIAKDVADAATAKGLKTVILLGSDATRAAYLNYMSCPNLEGNFYDGDANTEEIVTNDSSINSDDFSGKLASAFRTKVVNIWLACEAFNDPMLTAVMTTAGSQKYAAGVNDLRVGPSDNTAACAMKAALNGEPMTDAFHKCYDQFDTTDDQWGFDGPGSDLFGQ